MAQQFTCVRIQSMNGVNLNQFQFEFDLTWMAFFQNASGQTYTRYGGREDADSESHLTKASLLATMKHVLKLHGDSAVQVTSRYEPAAGEVATPAGIATMQPMIAKRKESCIHCHDVKVARLRLLREQGMLKKSMVFTYPSPANLGLHIDPDAQDLIARVEPGSAAAKAGLRKGDVVKSSDGQRILTYADFTRVLELAPATGELELQVVREKQPLQVSIGLPDGWRVSQDPSWRPSLGTIGSGAGFWGVKSNEKRRAELGLGDDVLAIKITFIWADHAKKAGVKLSDVVVAIDGQTHDMTMRQLHAHLQLHRQWGDEIKLTVRRGKKNVELEMRLPLKPVD